MKNNTEKLIELVEENRMQLVTEGIKAFKESYTIMSGWNSYAEIDIDGDISTGIRQENSFSESSFKGEAITVISFEHQEFNFEGEFEDYTHRIDMSEFKKFIAETYSNDENENYMSWNYFKEFNAQEYEDFVNEDKEWYIKEYAEEECEGKVDYTLECLQQSLDNEQMNY